ncbi:hypothetical protein ACX8Z9_14560 [Arthrobacter halodurans]|uniref:Uncharacterized protein n=1 Tax=Arthrobacter halodurans TaxID=516699 RepID=A0ABV4UKU4_9MICC
MRDYEKFVSDLRRMTSEDGDLESDGLDALSRVSIVGRDGRRLVFDAGLAKILEAVQRIDSSGLFDSPDGPLRLFSVHLMEALEMAPDGATRLELREYGVVAT